MAIIYITGVSGSGKSTVQKYLQSRGYTAYDVDDRAISGVYERASGQPIDMPPAAQRSSQWFTDHSWKIKPGAIENLKASANEEVIFLCGAASNDTDYWGLFDVSICLDIDEPTLRQRIAGRQDNDYGKNIHELEEILHWHKKATKSYVRKGAIVIDADRPVERVVNKIMEIVKEKLR